MQENQELRDGVASRSPLSWNREFRLGIDLFNDEKYFEAHEVLESLWRIEKDMGQQLYLQGLIQACGHFVHLQRKNWSGATTLAQKTIEKLQLTTMPATVVRLDLEPLYSALTYNLGVLGNVTMGRGLPQVDDFLFPKLFS